MYTKLMNRPLGMIGKDDFGREVNGQSVQAQPKIQDVHLPTTPRRGIQDEISKLIMMYHSRSQYHKNHFLYTSFRKDTLGIKRGPASYTLLHALSTFVPFKLRCQQGRFTFSQCMRRRSGLGKGEW